VNHASDTWHPRAHHLTQSGIAQLMARLGTVRYEDLQTLALREPERYWREVMAHCEIRWATPPSGYLDDARGPAFPRWFPGGRLNWVDTILAWADRPVTGGQPAIIAEREDGSVQNVPWSELGARVRDFAAGLADLGVGPGDRVGLLMENGVEASVSFMAVASLGAIVVPLFSGFGADAIVSRLAAAEASVVLATTGFWRRGRRVDVQAPMREALLRLPSVQRVVWKGDPGTASAAGAGTDQVDVDWQAVARAGVGRGHPPIAMDPNDPFMVIYTSGTTGKPKGVVHTHGGFPVKIAHDALVHFDIQPGDRFCWPADMGWIAGSLVMCSSLMRGATLVCYDGAPDFPDWSRMSRLVEQHRITHFGSAPTLIRGMAAHEAQALAGDRSSVRLLVTAGEAIDPEHFAWFQRRFGGGEHPLMNYTGGTEASGGLLASVSIKPIPPAGFNTISPGVDVDVVNTEGQPVTGAVGELVIRGAFIGMTQSFWQDDERYLETYWRTLPELWVHGDLALRTEGGDFFIMGRSDDTLKVAGKRLGPAEVEEVALEMPAVAEAAAIGVHDAEKGQKLVVFLVPSPGCAADDALLAEVAQRVADRLGRPFRPSAVHAVTQLPKTRSSKIMRRVIRSVYTGAPPGDLSSLDNPSALDQIRAHAPR
jgi:acetyl-CoA synthetase